MKILVAAPSRALTEARTLVGAGRSLGGRVAAICLGPGAEDAAGDLSAHGADEALWWDDPSMTASSAEAGPAVLETACREVGPEVVLMPGDSIGRDWGPRLAWRLEAGLVTECTGWERDAGGRLRFQRPVYGGKAVATIATQRPIQMAVVRPGSVIAPEPAASRRGTVRRFDVAVAAADAWPRVVERITEAATGPALEGASVVVAGGRGVGNAGGFELLQALAAVLGAAVGASRAAVDEGWVPASWQIGQTGKSVRPDLYVAVAISGASQHMAGVTAVRTIVAINADHNAPIFAAARLGVVGDYREIVPALTAALRELRER